VTTALESRFECFPETNEPRSLELRPSLREPSSDAQHSSKLVEESSTFNRVVSWQLPLLRTGAPNDLSSN